MILLISSEWLRFRSRRMVRVLAIVVVVAIAVAMVIAAATSKSQQPINLAELPEILEGTSFFAIIIGVVIGASAVGASWQSGTMTTILTWEPRRVRVAIVRWAVVAFGVFLVVLALLVLLSALFWVATSARGVTETPSGWGTASAGLVLRVSLVASVLSILGGALAMLGHNTAAALGALAVYMAVVENLIRGLRPGWVRFMLGDNIGAAVLGRDMSSGVVTLTPGRAWVVVGVYALILAAVAAASFHARDVT